MTTNRAIEKQLHYFKENEQTLLGQYGNKYVVISPTLQVNAFDTLEEGFSFGVQSYGYGNFMLRDCTDAYRSNVMIMPTITCL